MKPDRIWYLVMNAHRARIVQGLPGPGEPDEPELAVAASGRHLRAAMEEVPGRSFASAGGGRRSALEPGTDPAREDEREFVAAVAAELEKARGADRFDGLVVFAAPDALGFWRDFAPEGLRALVRDEVSRNLMRLSPHRLIEAIRAHKSG